jgi:hypothetical protein
MKLHIVNISPTIERGIKQAHTFLSTSESEQERLLTGGGGAPVVEVLRLEGGKHDGLTRAEPAP